MGNAVTTASVNGGRFEECEGHGLELVGRPKASRAVPVTTSWGNMPRTLS